MMKLNYYVLLLGILCSFMSPFQGASQCNIQASICQPGVAGPFNFVATSGSYAGGAFANAGCSTGAAGQHHYGFITLYITQSGYLNVLINGNASSGFIDVAIFNVPSGVAPCTAIQSGSNAIGCNYASTAGGCVQFGTSFPCSSSVPAPYVNAGDEIMIVAQSYTAGTSTSFTLELGTTPGSAQTGPPDATITSSGPYCTTDGPTQLVAASMGGTWSGPGVSPTGMFNPAVAGVGTHTINYAIGFSPCNSTASTQVTVGSVAISGMNVSNCQSGGVYSVSGMVGVSNPPSSGQLIVENCDGQQVVVASAPFSVGSYPFNLSGLNPNGAACDIHAYFTNSSCSHILNYTAPVCQGCTMLDLTTTVGACQPNGTYSVSGSVSFSNPPTTGTLEITTSCGGSQLFNAPFTSPTNYSIFGLTADGSSCIVKAVFSPDNTCDILETITAPTVVVPTFTPISACLGSSPPPLPATSNNGISGTWSPAVINTNTVGVTNYTFTPNPGGCAVPATMSVTINDLPNVSVPGAGVLYECLVSPTVQLNGNSSTPGVTYSWTGNGIVSGATTATATVNATGVYTLTVTNPATGCSNSASTSVIGDGNEPDVSIANPATITCSNPTVTLSANSPTPGATFAWTSNPGIISGGTTLTPTVNQAGTYQIVATGSNGCTNAASAVVSGNTNLPDVNTTPSSYVISCNNPTVSINGTSSVTGVSYAWTGPGIASGQNSGTITANTAGTYAVTVTNPVNSCVNSATYTVTGNTNPPAVSIANPSQLDCLHPTIQLQGTSVSGATASWTGPGVVSGGTTLTAVVNDPGTYVLTVTDPSNNCTSTAQVQVSEIPSVTPSTFSDTVICGSTFRVPLDSIVANGNVTWTEQYGYGSFNNPTLTNPVFTGVNGVTNYNLVFTDECGYTATGRVSMIRRPVVSVPPYSCVLTELDISTVSHNGGVWYAIENTTQPYVQDTTVSFLYGDTLTGGPQITGVTVPEHGVYYMYFHSNDICPDTTITLNFLPYIWTEINDTTLCEGVHYELNAYESPYNVDYSWNTGSTGTSITVTQPGAYIVTITNDCYAYSDTAVVAYEKCEIEAPNVISLSSSSGNNTWFVDKKGVADFRCVIVNRWGNLIYEFNDVNGHWDGRDMGGTVVSEGVYFYTIQATYEGGEEVTKQGFIHVVH